jgi:hypothetical protein
MAKKHATDAEHLTDAEGKKILREWPRRTKKLWPPPAGKGYWIRAQPKDGKQPGPRIFTPGAKLFSTQPDALWVHFDKIESCDIVAVEVCGTNARLNAQNLNDKRSRYIPASHSIVLDCSLKWLEEVIDVQHGASKPRWQAAASFGGRPSEDARIPVRHLRVLYALPNKLYEKWCPHHTPTGYEFFCPHSSLDSYNSGKMQAFLRQMSLAAQFYLKI